MPAKSSAPSAAAHAAPPGWSPPARTAAGLLLLIHLTIVISVPLAMVPPSSPVAESIVRFAAPYVQAGNVSHGYAFFAPDPGRFSHLVRYRLEFDDGRPPREGTLPDLNDHWPRLLYHRHFMLTEQLGAHWLGGWEQLPEEIRRPALERMTEQAAGYAEHLRQRHDADRVSLDLVRHYVPSPLLVIEQGLRLDDESLYETFPRSPLVVVHRPPSEAAP